MGSHIVVLRCAVLCTCHTFDLYIGCIIVSTARAGRSHGDKNDYYSGLFALQPSTLGRPTYCRRSRFRVVCTCPVLAGFTTIRSNGNYNTRTGRRRASHRGEKIHKRTASRLKTPRRMRRILTHNQTDVHI